MNTQTTMITLEEFKEKFKNWKESIYTNPGRYLGHYTALIKPHGLKDDDPENPR